MSVKENLVIARSALYEHAQNAQCPLIVDMSTWFMDENGEEYELDDIYMDEGEKNPNVCGTVGCALGHIAVLLGDSEEHPQFRPLGGETFREYAMRLFADPDEEINSWDFVEFTDFGSWLFSCDWSEVDDTMQGIIKRFDYVIEHGDVPEWYSQALDKRTDEFASEYNCFYEGIAR